MSRAKHIILLLLTVLTATATTVCSGGGTATTTIEDAITDPLPEFTPDSGETLANLVINTFTDNGINITTNPEYIDFNETGGTIEKDDVITKSVTLTNNSGQDLKFSFEIYAVSTGFAVLDENKINVGSWDAIEIANGESQTFFIQFTAWVFGTQTSYITISANIDGFIRLPLRATVTGAADFRIIPSGYFCSDEDAPQITSLDFYKVAHGQSETHEIKLCNSGGEDIAVTSARIENDTATLTSKGLDTGVFDEFLWSTNESIDSLFAFGKTPVTTEAFVAPSLTDYGSDLNDPASHFDVTVHHTGDPVENLLIKAGRFLHLDVSFSPNFAVEAPEGFLYNALPVNARLTLDTSLGPVTIPLVAATSGAEPTLAMSYRVLGSGTWRQVDLNSDGPAIYFGTVKVFKDWVANNEQVVEVKIQNSGTGTKELAFWGDAVNGFFEYYWDDSDEPLQFPIRLAAHESQIFKMRYIPSAANILEDDFEATWDFGQFYFSHTGGNGPYGKVVLVGEKDAGYAVALLLGGTELKREYGENESENLCVFKADPDDPTSKTFTVVNNNKKDTLKVAWEISYNSSEVTVSPVRGSFSVDPDSKKNFTIRFAANKSMVGLPVSATLTVNTTFSETESLFASEVSDLETRNFVVPLKATGSETGDSVLCGTGVLGEADSMEVTMIMDRILMALPPSLTETTRNLPPFKFHLPLEVNREKGTVRIRKNVDFVYDKSDPDFSPIKQIRSYVHQATNTKGCAPLPTNPYRLEFEKGSWTGEGIECADEGAGTIRFTDPNSGESFVINSDTACLDNNGAESYTDPETGEEWKVFYHDFVKFDSCNVQFYGKISTFAFKPAEETITDKFERIETSPNESESFYEEAYGAYQFDSFITFLEDTSCGSQNMKAGETLSDPDEIKEFYLCLASQDTTTRRNGFLNECSYFNFSIDEGVVPDDVDSDNPDTDSWEGFGTYEPYVDENGNISETKYDMTIYNGHMRAFVIGAGDRTNFFAHPGHLVYSHIYVTLTTRPVADPNSRGDNSWQDLIAVKTRPHFDKEQVYMQDGDLYNIKTYWTEDGMSEYFSNVIDHTGLDKGIDYGGFGRGNFRYVGGSRDTIVPAGWPVNFDENNLLVMVALGTFTGKGNTAPSFAKADAATGKGKALYFTFHGCLVAGDPAENQGCFDYQLDNATLLTDPSTKVIEEYAARGMLPNGSVEAADCVNLEDPGFADRDKYEYMPCINFKIFDRDRDRLTNYYDKTGRFEYDDNSYYNATTCGVGM